MHIYTCIYIGFKVRRKIAKTETISEAHYKQMPADYVSFQKDMYFFPGLSLAGNTGGVSNFNIFNTNIIPQSTNK